MNRIEEPLRVALIDAKCRNFRLVETGTLIVYFDASVNESLQDSRLWIDCAWRLRGIDSVIVGSFDDPEKLLTSLRQLNGQVVTGVTVDSVTGDLRLSFSSDIVIDAFCYSISGEHWELRQSNGQRIGLGPNLVGYVRMEEPDHKNG